jgi:hypothetical protein
MPKLQEKPSAPKSEQPALQRMKILSFFLFFGSFFPSWIRIRIQQLKLMRIHADPDTDPDPKPWSKWIKLNHFLEHRCIAIASNTKNFIFFVQIRDPAALIKEKTDLTDVTLFSLPKKLLI